MAGIDRLQGLALVNSQELLKVFSKHRKDNPGNVFRDEFFQPYFVLADTLTQDLGLQGVLAMLDTMGVDQDLQRINSGQFDFVSHVEQRLTAGHTLQDVVKEIDHLIDFIKVCVEAMKQETYNTERASKTLEILEIYKSAIESRIETTSQSKGS